MGDVFPIVVVVLFWLAAFVFAWWFTARTLRVPIQYEEEHAAQSHDAHEPSEAAH